MKNIFLDLLKNKPSNDFYFRKKSYWVFPDGFVYKSKLYSPILVLYHKNNPLGLINYTNSPTSNKIIINFIQGVKQEENNFNYKNLEKPFYEIILDSFIKASLKTGKKIVYDPVTLQNEYNKNYIKNKKKQLETNSKIIKKLEERIKKEKDKAKLKSLVLERIQYKKANIEIQETVLKIDRLITINGKIRDRYFTKLGELNPNKERVKRLLLNHLKEKKAPLSFKRIPNFLKLKKPK